MYKIAVLPGDGIGIEIIPQAVRVLSKTGDIFQHDFEFFQGLIGGEAIDKMSAALPAETLRLCRECDAILLGAVGGPKWDRLPAEQRPEVAALLPLRKQLGLYANLRQAVCYPPLADASTLKPEIVGGTDIILIRELTGGIYFGEKTREYTQNGITVTDTLQYSEEEIARILRLGFGTAYTRKKKLCSVDKANVLESSRLWRETAIKLACEYPEVELEHMYVDNCAMQLIRRPKRFDVIVTENMFGDILSDEAAMLTGSLGMLPSASIGGETCLFEPVHGSAPDIAGKDIANPIAAIMSAALLLRLALKMDKEASLIEQAVVAVLDDGYRTADIMQPGRIKTSTVRMTDQIINKMDQLAKEL